MLTGILMPKIPIFFRVPGANGCLIYSPNTIATSLLIQSKNAPRFDFFYFIYLVVCEVWAMYHIMVYQYDTYYYSHEKFHLYFVAAIYGPD